MENGKRHYPIIRAKKYLSDFMGNHLYFEFTV